MRCSLNGRTRIYLKHISTFRAGENRVRYIKRGIAPFGFQTLIRRRRLIALNLNPFFEASQIATTTCVPKSYSALLWNLYRNQKKMHFRGKFVDIERGVRQGDVISPFLSNAGLEHALRKWKLKLKDHGFQIGAVERLINIRHTDDIMPYAKSMEELVDMLELLFP